MINCKVKRDHKDIIIGFTIESHGDPLVCSAVSTIAINTVNSIEELTDTDISYGFEEEGGYLDFHIENYENANDAILLLKSLHLGLKCLEMEHKTEVKLIDKIVKKR